MHSDGQVIKELIEEWFENNYERLRAESGHALAPEVRETAKQHVLMYWKRLKGLAESITDTEVILNLPNQRTAEGTEYNIEGVVDIVRDKGNIAMYDVKTLDQEDIWSDLDFYEEQLNIYAHIWMALYGQDLNEAAIIATQYPEPVKRALRQRDRKELQRALSDWDPIVPIRFDAARVKRTVRDFGKVVDKIVGGEFAPPMVKRLGQKDGKTTFAVRVCRNCDARHSCRSYRKYARSPKGRSTGKLREFYADLATPDERADRLDSALDAESEGRSLADA